MCSSYLEPAAPNFDVMCEVTTSTLLAGRTHPRNSPYSSSAFGGGRLYDLACALLILDYSVSTQNLLLACLSHRKFIYLILILTFNYANNF